MKRVFELDKIIGVVGETPKELDQYFTKQSIAIECVTQHLETLLKDSSLGLSVFSTILEPSFGGGSFLVALQKYASQLLYFDIDAVDEKHKRDFLLPDQLADVRSPTLTIGNPPFSSGTRGNSVACAFFNRAAEFSEVIALYYLDRFEKYQQ